MVWQLLIELAPTNGSRSLSPSPLPLSKRLVCDSPTAARGLSELLNQWWSPHKLSKHLSPGGADQLCGDISS